MISRGEARDILGSDKVEFATDKLAGPLDDLLRSYEDDFQLRATFFMNSHLGNDPTKNARFISGAIESRKYSYLHETNAILNQASVLPPNVQIQIPVGQNMPLIAGLPRQYTIDLTSNAWVHNKDPKGVTK
jgi:hypothetical protein